MDKGLLANVQLLGTQLLFSCVLTYDLPQDVTTKPTMKKGDIIILRQKIIRNLIRDNVISLKYIKSKRNLTHSFTKGLCNDGVYTKNGT